MALELVAISLDEAKQFVGEEHRHHAPPVGHKFSIGAAVRSSGDRADFPSLVGVVVVGRPVARAVNHRRVAEVTRLATNGTKNACSFLYAAAARAAQAMGFRKIQTYILASEPGTSLKAAGWLFDGWTEGGDWNRGKRTGRRTDQPMGPKQRWIKNLVRANAASCSLKAAA
jgi:hypothetical protein